MPGARNTASALMEEALAFIRSDATKGITPDDVARHLKCSRRLLYLRFSEFNRRSVAEEISRARLERVKTTLRGSSRSIDSIARDCGFPNTGTLRNLFRRTYGNSLRDYRAAARAN